MRVQYNLSEDEIKIIIAKWFQSLGKGIKPQDVIITHCTSGHKSLYGASISYEEANEQPTTGKDGDK